MRSALNVLVVLSYLGLMSCGVGTDPTPSSGETDIQFSTGSDHGTGFSFSKGERIDLPNPSETKADFIIEFQTSEDGTLQGLFLSTASLHPAFTLKARPETIESAQTYFDKLTQITDTSFIDLALSLDENQVWGMKTLNNKYAKILIEVADATADTTDQQVVQFTGHLKMKWAWQPDGSRQFSDF